MDGSERVSGDWSTSCQLSSLPLPASVAPFLTAGAPNCMLGDVWVEGVSPQGVQLNRGSAWSGALGLPHLLTPGLTSQLHLSPGPTDSHTEHINPLTRSVPHIDTQDTSLSLSSNNSC